MASLLAFRGWIYATILIGIFFWTPTTGRAEGFAPQIPECKGRDLLTDLKVNNSVAYERWLTEARKIPNGEAMLWRINGEGLTEPSWLFGTMHVTDPRIVNLPMPIQEAFMKSRLVVVEIKGLESRWGSWINNLFALPLYYLPDNLTWDRYLTDREMRYMELELLIYGRKIEDFKRWQPWAMMLDILSYPACEYWRAYGGLNYLDAQLADWAHKAGKPVLGFETWYESARTIADTDIRSQFRAMLALARMTADPEDEQETTIRMYLNRQVHWYLAYEGGPYDLSPEEISALREFDHYSIDVRNLTMRDRALPLVEKGGAFIAVGAAHLPGDKGLVELFRKAGYVVTPVN
jgi:uncharacterized protein